MTYIIMLGDKAVAETNDKDKIVLLDENAKIIEVNEVDEEETIHLY